MQRWNSVRCGEQRRYGAGSVGGSADRGEVVEEATPMLLTGGGHREHARHELVAGIGLGTQVLLAPADGGPHGAFGGVVGRLDAGHGDEGPARV